MAIAKEPLRFCPYAVRHSVISVAHKQSFKIQECPKSHAVKSIAKYFSARQN